MVAPPRIEEVPGWMPLAVSVGAIVVALILGGVVLVASQMG